MDCAVRPGRKPYTHLSSRHGRLRCRHFPAGGGGERGIPEQPPARCRGFVAGLRCRASPPRRAFTCHHFTLNAKSRGTTPMNPHALALGLSLPVLALAGALPVQHTPRQDRGHCLQRESPAERAAPRRGPAGTGSLLAGEMNQPPVEAPSANPPMVSPREPCPHGMSRRMRRVMLAVARRVSFALRGSRAS